MIQAFTIHKKLLDLLTHELHVDYSFAIKSGKMGPDIKRTCTTFKEHLGGNAYLNTAMRDWFMGCLEDFIKHKRKIIESGHHPEQVQPLNICWDAYQRFEKLTNENLFTQFLRGFEWFSKILPSPNNPSYESSLHNLNELKKFCEKKY